MEPHGPDAEPEAPLEPQLRRVIDALPVLVWSAQPDGSVDFVNQRWQEFTGLDVGRGLAWGWRAAVHPDDLPSLLDAWRTAVATGEPLEKEARFRGAHGRYHWFLARAVPVRDGYGRIVKWYGTSLDVEGRKRAEEVLHQSHAVLRIQAEQALEHTGLRLAVQSEALTRLTATPAAGPMKLNDRLRSILASCARAIEVERVSVWSFSPDRGTIHCLDLYELNDDRHSSDLVLSRGTYPRYFAALERERLIAADDADEDERTREFASDYLVAHGIGAMLDVPLNQHGVVVGVLCLEHVGAERQWRADERNFALSVANIIAAAFAEEDRRQALARLAESEARARLVVDTAHDAFVGIDPAGRIVMWNAQAEATFGWTAAEAMGQRLVDTIIPPAFREAHLHGMRRFHETGEAPIVNQRLELTAIHRSGREFPIELTITSPTPLEDGHFFGAFLRDISDRRERDAQLRRAKESAEAATRAKSEFLANMSHELRTPLNGVLGYSQLLQRDRSLSATQRDALEAIAKCGSHLLALINDVLDLSKIEAGRMEIEESTTDLKRLTLDLKYVIGEAARRKGLRLSMHIAPDVPRRVVLDGRHLRQVLLNLLGNAIKFTDDGEVRLEIGRAGGDRLLFEVADTGIGIAPDALEAIFDAFTQTDAGSAAGGSGLGLAISQRLVKSMGDELRVSSVPGEGSRFCFALPLVPGEASEVDPLGDADDRPAADRRLAEGEEVTALVVDDSTVSRRILAALLESTGVGVISAASGHEGLALARAHRPDVVFMDIRMAGLDGLETTRRLHADPVTAGIPVIAVTASAFGTTREAALAAGCVEYLAKPISMDAVLAALHAHLGVRVVESVRLPTPAESVHDVTDRLAIAGRVAAAIEVGDVTDLERLVQELSSGSSTEAALGQRIARHTAAFDFDGLRDLATALGDGRSS
jgi:PAS domain S-box-containing protein